MDHCCSYAGPPGGAVAPGTTMSQGKLLTEPHKGTFTRPAPCLRVRDADLCGQRHGLARQDVALGDVLRLEHLVVRHLHLSACELAGAGPADSLAAGERRVEALVDEDVEHAGPRRPRQDAGLAIQ